MGTDERIGPHEADHDTPPPEAQPSRPGEATARARWNDDGGYQPTGGAENAEDPAARTKAEAERARFE